MKKVSLLLSAGLLLLALQTRSQNCGPFRFESFNRADSAAALNNPEESFVLSQEYPAALPAAPAGGFPWEKISFKRDPEKFMRTVLSYCWEGNEEANFYVQKNTLRKWYHAPMLTNGAYGREFVHGLRSERISEPGELHPDQKRTYRNYSVSFYNEPGGYTIGQVWCNPNEPDPKKANFPAGTVMFRLVFTTADTAEVPYLLNSMRWMAYVDAATSAPFGKKGLEDVNLLQVDIGVKTSSTDAPTGWVFGTFVYNGALKGAKVADRLVPVGLQWGNDPQLTDTVFRAGGKPTECWINSAIVGKNGLVQYMGNKGRVTGLVDGKSGSLLSDYATACWPTVAVQPNRSNTPDQVALYFRNLSPGTPFSPASVSLDYSLDLAAGIYNFYSIKGAPEGLPVIRGDINQFNEIEAGSIPVKEEVVAEPEPEGLVGARLVKFVFFSVLIVVLIGLLVLNILRKPKE